MMTMARLSRAKLFCAVSLLALLLMLGGCTLIPEPPLSIGLVAPDGTLVSRLTLVRPDLEAVLQVEGGGGRGVYAIDWGDGTSVTVRPCPEGPTVIRHTYTAAGIHTVSVNHAGRFASTHVAVVGQGMAFHGFFFAGGTPPRWRARTVVSIAYRHRGCDPATGEPLWLTGVENLDPGRWWAKLIVTGPEGENYTVYIEPGLNVTGQWVESAALGDPERFTVFLGWTEDQPPFPLALTSAEDQNNVSFRLELKNKWGHHSAWSARFSLPPPRCGDQ